MTSELTRVTSYLEQFAKPTLPIKYIIQLDKTFFQIDKGNIRTDKSNFQIDKSKWSGKPITIVTSA